MAGLLMISGLFFFRCVEYPLIGFTTPGLVFALYCGRMTRRGGVPNSGISPRKRYFAKLLGAAAAAALRRR